MTKTTQTFTVHSIRTGNRTVVHAENIEKAVELYAAGRQVKRYDLPVVDPYTGVRRLSDSRGEWFFDFDSESMEYVEVYWTRQNRVLRPLARITQV